MYFHCPAPLSEQTSAKPTPPPIAPCELPIPPARATREWELSAEGQAYIQFDNARYAAENPRQTFARSTIHIRSFLRGWNGALDHVYKGHDAFGTRKRGDKPSSFGIAFAHVMAEIEAHGHWEAEKLCRIQGVDDHELYNEAVERLRAQYPEEYPDSGNYSVPKDLGQNYNDLRRAFEASGDREWLVAQVGAQRGIILRKGCRPCYAECEGSEVTSLNPRGLPFWAGIPGYLRFSIHERSQRNWVRIDLSTVKLYQASGAN